MAGDGTEAPSPALDSRELVRPVVADKLLLQSSRSLQVDDARPDRNPDCISGCLVLLDEVIHQANDLIGKFFARPHENAALKVPVDGLMNLACERLSCAVLASGTRFSRFSDGLRHLSLLGHIVRTLLAGIGEKQENTLCTIWIVYKI